MRQKDVNVITKITRKYADANSGKECGLHMKGDDET